MRARIEHPQIFWHAFKDAIRRFFKKDGLMRASYIAMSMMLAIFPFCILALSIAGMLSIGQITQNYGSLDDLLQVVFGSWPEVIAQPIENEVRAVLETSRGSTVTVGAVLTIFLASNGFEAVRSCISDAYHEVDPRPVWKQRLISVIFAIGGAICVTIAGVIGVVLPIYVRYVSEVAPGLQLQIMNNDVAGSLVTVLFILVGLIAIHKWLPGVKRPFKAIMPGVLLTMLLWGIGARAFDYYIQTFSTYSMTYAGLAGVMTALVFLYLMAAVLVLGAEYNARLGELAQQRKKQGTGGGL